MAYKKCKAACEALFLREEGVTFKTNHILVCLADGSQIERGIKTTRVKIRLGSRTFSLNLVAFPEAKRNDTGFS